MSRIIDSDTSQGSTLHAQGNGGRTFDGGSPPYAQGKTYGVYGSRLNPMHAGKRLPDQRIYRPVTRGTFTFP